MAGLYGLADRDDCAWPNVAAHWMSGVGLNRMITEVRRGGGPPIVFVHGLIGHLRLCAEAAISYGRDTCAPDLLGYGALADVADAEISLAAQANKLQSCIRDAYGNTAVDIVGHSVGGVISMLLAYQDPSMVRRVVSVEGNFTLKDAFWSASLGRMSAAEAAAVLAGLAAEPAAWLERSGVQPSAENLAIAKEWLGFQPATTLRAMGRSITDVTGDPNYLEIVRKVFASHHVCLLAGERSRAEWDVPTWASLEAAAQATLPGTGHMLMLEQPERFMRALFDML